MSAKLAGVGLNLATLRLQHCLIGLQQTMMVPGPDAKAAVALGRGLVAFSNARVFGLMLDTVEQIEKLSAGWTVEIREALRPLVAEVVRQLPKH